MVILQKKVPGLTENSLARFVLRARRAAGLRGTVNVLVTTGAAIRSLNREFRGQNKTTDVLSFPWSNAVESRSKSTHSGATPLGEIAISAEMAASNSSRLGHSAAEEVKILTLHGILHLAGFDHERDNGSMARKEAHLRKALGLSDGLIERASSRHKSTRNRTTAHRAAGKRSAA